MNKATRNYPERRRIPHRLETDRLCLRCYNPQDAESLRANVESNVEHLGTFMPWAQFEPQNLDQKMELVLGFRSEYDADRNLVIGAMRNRTMKAGDILIQEGDAKANDFFVLEKGAAAAYVGGNQVAEYGPKGSFGELALLYNCPRAATVKCTSSGVAWALDRMTFRHVLASSWLDHGWPPMPQPPSFVPHGRDAPPHWQRPPPPL